MKKNHKNQKQRNNFSFAKTSSSSSLIYGKHPVVSAILGKKRKIYQLFLTSRALSELEQQLKKNNFHLNPSLIRIVDNDFLKEILNEDALHQGFVLEAAPLPTIDENDFLAEISKKEKPSLEPILILDQLTDPHNIGAIIRSAMAFGVKNIVIPDRNTPKNSAAMNKASSGTMEFANLILAGNINNFLNDIKQIGYWCIGLAGEAKEDLIKAKEYNPIALVVGSEGDGIRDLVKKNCDLLVKIPISSQVESLNASTATAISLYEIFKK